jgi:hypothetical protein
MTLAKNVTGIVDTDDEFCANFELHFVFSLTGVVIGTSAKTMCNFNRFPRFSEHKTLVKNLKLNIFHWPMA